MFVKYNDKSIRYTGRWDFGYRDSATTTAPGGMIEIAYYGTFCVLHFDVDVSVWPSPHVWIILDDGGKIEASVDHFLRVEANYVGVHTIKIIFKSSVEVQHRWYRPLSGRISFKGMEVEQTAQLTEDNRKVIEFLGDSITEGVLIDADNRFAELLKFEQMNRPCQDDVTATYAYLTALNLGMKPVIMGYGGVGVTKTGAASVPIAADAYPYNFDGSLANTQNADVIVINYGANDRNAPYETFEAEYLRLLDEVRKRNPGSQIVAVSAFCGVYAKELRSIVEKYNEKMADNVVYIDSTGWLPQGPLHPSRESHVVIAKYLTEELKKRIMYLKEQNK